jgi:hypothetical protein
MSKVLFYSLLLPMIFFQTQVALAQAGKTTKEQSRAHRNS